VAANLARLRQERGLSTTRLAAALEELGQLIPATGITRIEKGQRRVDSDDLVALAVALNVSPAALLLPPTNDQSTVALTSAFEVTARTAWRWAEGEQTAVDYEPSPVTSTGGDPAVAVERLEQQQDFERRQMTYQALTHPWGPGASKHQAVRLSRDLADAVEALVSAEPDTPRGDLDARARLAQRRYTQLGPELEELADRIPPVHPGIQPRHPDGAE
jgi:transcriptional regulator with XRE-family HTH domain